jgi:hypothetical protein
MKRANQTTKNGLPIRVEAVTQLNDIHDALMEIQSASNFLGCVVSDAEKIYSEQVMSGASICFNMLNERFEKVIGKINQLTKEEKSV